MAAEPVLGDHADSAHTIARSLGVRDRDVRIAPRQGQVNLTIFLGDDLVLRVPRRPEYAARLAKEAAVIPFVRARGIPTADVVRFDDERTVADTAYLVLERLHGTTIDELPPPGHGGERAHRSLAEILVELHGAERNADTLIDGVDAFDCVRGELLDELVGAGELGGAQTAWLGRWFELLESNGARDSPPVLLHGDVMASNLILDDSGAVAAIIDWGSARWGEAVRDLAGFRTTQLPTVVDAYRDAANRHRPDDLALEAGALWYQLFFALSKLLGRTSTSEQRNWSAPRASRLLELMRFATTGGPDRWHALLPRDWRSQDVARPPAH